MINVCYIWTTYLVLRDTEHRDIPQIQGETEWSTSMFWPKTRNTIVGTAISMKLTLNLTSAVGWIVTIILYTNNCN